MRRRGGADELDQQRRHLHDTRQVRVPVPVQLDKVLIHLQVRRRPRGWAGFNTFWGSGVRAAWDKQLFPWACRRVGSFDALGHANCTS